MGRPRRRIRPGTLHVIAARAASECTLFRSGYDHATYARLIDRAARRALVGIEALVHLDSVVLIVAAPTSGLALSCMLQATHGAFARHVRRCHGGSGPIWQAHPAIVPIPHADVRETIAIVERTPHRLGFVLDPIDHDHGSARAHAVPSAPRPSYLTIDALARPRDRSVWRRILRQDDDPAILDRLVDRTRRSIWMPPDESRTEPGAHAQPTGARTDARTVSHALSHA